MNLLTQNLLNLLRVNIDAKILELRSAMEKQLTISTIFSFKSHLSLMVL